MNEFKEPMRMLHKRFTKSEIAIMSWTSQEQIANLEKDKPKMGQDTSYTIPIPDETPSSFLNEDGEIDIRKMTGKEAARYFAKMGMNFIPIVK